MTNPDDVRRAARAAARAFLAGMLALAAAAPGAGVAQDGQPYFPDRWSWETRRPEDLGMDGAKLRELVAFAAQSERPTHLNGDQLREMLAGEPYNEVVGPTMERGPNNGLVVKDGYIVLEWGDTRRVDWTFSAAKSYLATTTGLALDAGLIESMDDPVHLYVPELFDDPHNRKITWEHLLHQSSEWQGTLWGKPDWADRYDGERRPVLEPGTKFTYNDVRVNLAALATTHVLRQPLPVALREKIMDPIGASTTWRWHGYENSWIELDGLRMNSVSGGGHWGGGVWISARDHARFGLLHLRNGLWKGQRLLSEEWIRMATTPGPSPVYGYMWWLNTDGRVTKSAPASAFYAAGGGGNFVWVDQENDLLVVLRWVPDLAGAIDIVMAALDGAARTTGS